MNDEHSNKINKLENRLATLENSIGEIKQMIQNHFQIMNQKTNEKNNVCTSKDVDTFIRDGEHLFGADFTNIPRSYQMRIMDIMDNFDFEKVHSVMKFLNWKWVYSKSEDGIPTIDELKNCAATLLIDAITDATSFSTGGFKAEYYDGSITLLFCIEDIEGLDDDE